ncbi:hypothetical protein F53441_10723 [Fusarium austroafricanum]|uniref:Uncharacterized protein n=1 Tax=Fusarium austroafricanum TaxID=2364996 RepID=A0A8H4K8B4_9HYPO|nr:hypothetical protein F53441_10723 [Fusarium austroafricanum]
MWFTKALTLFAATSMVATAHPTDTSLGPRDIDERATVELSGRKVSVVTGIVFNQALRDCFGSSGVDIVQAYAGAIYDQWRFSKLPGVLVDIQTLVSTKQLTNQFCFTVDAVFQFAGKSDAQKFATFAKNLLGPTKRDDEPDSFLGRLKPDVYIEGVDLPEGHEYFGSNSTNPTHDLSKRGIGKCRNKCGFSFTNDQTGICRDSTFPAGNSGFC